MDDKRSWRSSVGILQNGQSWNDVNKIFPQTPASPVMVNAGIIVFIATIFFIISFTSPYWLVSYHYTYSSFENMGLWEFCFNEFRYPQYQFDRKFDGCNYIYSEEYLIIREWMLPAWFATVQAFMIIALLSSFSSLIIISLVLTRLPMQFTIRYEWHLTGIACICQGVSGVSILFAVLIFGTSCFRRDWLLNPNFNYLSWSYAFAVFSGGIHAFGGLTLLHETYKARDRKRQATNLLHNEPQGQLGPGIPMEGQVYM
ncbi:unnamed protein product [Meganyctiphanes norvegica]|uniref:Uncharacterized protein n=1 Tax=Meganyctiphanes norvegica TaxID=48144 RepID=A0AAV2QYD2_MEGNR